MTRKSRPNSRSGFKRVRTLVAAVLFAGAGQLMLAAAQARADEAPLDATVEVQKESQAIREQKHEKGLTLVYSGSLGLAFSIPAYYLSNDLFAKVIYSFTQNLSTAAIGYGAQLLIVDDEYTRFQTVLSRVPSLTAQQKEELNQNFLIETRNVAANGRKIQAISHGMAAGLNLLSAATTTQPELRTVLYVLSGVNLIASLNFALRKSEEEKKIDQHLHADVFGGPSLGGAQLSWAF